VFAEGTLKIVIPKVLMSIARSGLCFCWKLGKDIFSNNSTTWNLENPVYLCGRSFFVQAKETCISV